MERTTLLASFSRRLVERMIKKGYGSCASKAKVTIKELAEVAECTPQMARRYALGEAFPDAVTIYHIAKWLDISPGWLLYGEEGDKNTKFKKLDKNMIDYLIAKSAHLLTGGLNNQKEVLKFIFDLAYGISKMDISDEMIKKMIDLSIKSAECFSHLKPKNQAS
ncbi:MAG: helix-turn-helix domain-containing protein [Francisellaceae bacterium]